MEKRLYDLEINERFEKIAPPLSDREFGLLRDDILAHGCITPLIVWDGIIIDGHHRYKICRRYGIPFKIVEMEFDGDASAVAWIITNQLARRNLSPFQRCEMVLPYEAELKAEAKKKRRERISHYRRTSEIRAEETPDTRDILANMAGVSHSTLAMVQKILRIGDKETIRRVRNAEISINSAYRSLLVKVDPPHVVVPAIKAPVVMDGPVRVATPAFPSRLDDIDSIVEDLIGKVSAGDASPKRIIEDLRRVSEMVREEIRRQ